MAECLISFGSNQGDGPNALGRVLDALDSQPRFHNVQCSRLHSTVPIGGSEPQANYVNAAIRLSTDFEPSDLLDWLLKLEGRLGRVRHGRWGPRTVDLDLLLYDQQCIRHSIENGPPLIVPHPRMSFRRFVLVPAAEIAADMIHATARMSIGDLLSHLNSSARIVVILGKSALSQAVARETAAKHKPESIDTGNNFAIMPVESMRQWNELELKPMLVVYLRRDYEEAVIPSIREIVDAAYSGPRLELESAGTSAAAREIAAAIAATLPDSIL